MPEPELLVMGTVLRWAQGAFPGQPIVADTAVDAAFRAYAAGESVSEACREGRRSMRGN